MAPQQELVCECDVSQKGSAFCKRHRIDKNQTLRKLCQAGQRGVQPGVRYWARWEAGKGPRQNLPTDPAESEEDRELVGEALERLGIGDLAKNYTRALTRWAKAGYPVRSDREVRRIYETICRPCDHHETLLGVSYCRLCGCQLSSNGLAIRNKIKMATENCPRAEWGRKKKAPCSGGRGATERFVRISDLQSDTLKLLARVPPDVSAVVGIARSGLLPASILATLLHVPLYSVSRSGVTDLGYGTRLGERGAPACGGTILLVDDTAFAGTAMRTYPAIVERAFAGQCRPRIVKAVVYTTPEARKRVDLYAAVLPKPHRLEWHWFNSPMVARAAFDFDGILCHDCPPGDDDDGPRYREFLQRAEPLYTPRHTPIPLVVTARLEKYRELTEAWLARHRIRVKRLVMGPWKSNARAADRLARFKAKHYRAARQLDLFVESDPNQAEEIAVQSRKAVMCPAVGKVFQ